MPRLLSFSALNLVSVCPTDHYCLDSNPVPKGNVFASSEPITFTSTLAYARPAYTPSAYQDINMVHLGVEPCVIEHFACLRLVHSKPSGYLSSFEIKARTYTAMLFFFIQKYQHIAKSWESSVPRITNKPDEQTRCPLKIRQYERAYANIVSC